jgi:hypothetical protein
MIVQPSVITYTTSSQDKLMTGSTIQPRTAQSLEINPMVNYYALFQQNLFSFNNNALFIGGRKATKQQLVPMIAKARVQLVSDLANTAQRGLTGATKRIGEDLVSLDETTRQLCLSKDVAFYIANNTPTKG